MRRCRLVVVLLAAATAACTSSAAVASRSVTPSVPPVSASAPSTPIRTPSSPTPTPSPSRTEPASTPATSPATTPPAIPPVSARAQAVGLIDVRTVVPNAIIDMRYATKDNFTGVRLYPRDARCLVHRSMAAGLRTAARRLRHEGDVLVFWDCYRPHYVQVHMFRIVPDPNWVARPGPYATSHEAGRSVDVTLALASTGRPLRMGTGFDDFTARAHAFATEGISATARANRARLRAAMAAGGLTVYSGEWWHFDGPGSFVARPYLRAPLT